MGLALKILLIGSYLTSYREILLYNTILFMLLTHFGLFELFKEIIQVNQIDEFMYVYDMCK